MVYFFFTTNITSIFFYTTNITSTCRCVPRIEMTYDHRHRFLLKVTFTVDKKTSFATEEELVKILLQDLILAGVVCVCVCVCVCLCVCVLTHRCSSDEVAQF